MIESVIHEGTSTIWVACGLNRESLVNLLMGAMANATLSDGRKLRFYVSLLKNRSMDVRGLALGADVCLALRPTDIKILLDRPYCHELRPDIHWYNKGSSRLPVAFLFFNTDLVSMKSVLQEAEYRENPVPRIG